MVCIDNPNVTPRTLICLIVLCLCGDLIGPLVFLFFFFDERNLHPLLLLLPPQESLPPLGSDDESRARSRHSGARRERPAARPLLTHALALPVPVLVPAIEER